MRISYWSNSKFAAKLRSLFGIQKQPFSATCKGWSDYRIEAKKKSNFGYELIERLDTLQDLVFFVPDKVKDVSRFFRNLKDGTHVLKTQTKVGQWSDLVSKIPDALMLSIIDFVEVECAHMEESSSDDHVDSRTPATKGIAWLEFQIKSASTTKRENERHPYRKIIAAYSFAKKEYLDFDVYKELGIDTSCLSHFEFSDEKAEMFNQINKRELKFNSDTTRHCNNIVKYRDYLWT